jgi:hypothetical protein
MGVSIGICTGETEDHCEQPQAVISDALTDFQPEVYISKRGDLKNCRRILLLLLPLYVPWGEFSDIVKHNASVYTSYKTVLTVEVGRFSNSPQ